MSIGDNIKLYREARGLNIAQFAQRLGISPAECVGIENGRRVLNSSEIKRICEILNLTIEDLLSSPSNTPSKDEEGSILMPVDELQNLLGKMKE